MIGNKIDRAIKISVNLFLIYQQYNAVNLTKPVKYVLIYKDIELHDEQNCSWGGEETLFFLARPGKCDFMISLKEFLYPQMFICS